MFEVRSECTASQKEYWPECQYNKETARTDRKAAEQDVDLLKLFGKKAWIVEV